MQPGAGSQVGVCEKQVAWHKNPGRERFQVPWGRLDPGETDSPQPTLIFCSALTFGFWTPVSQVRAGEGLRYDLDLALSAWGFEVSLLGGEREREREEEEVEGKWGEKGDNRGKGGGGRNWGGEGKRSEAAGGAGGGKDTGVGGRRDDWLPSVILSSEGEERMRKQEIRPKGGMERGRV